MIEKRADISERSTPQLKNKPPGTHLPDDLGQRLVQCVSCGKLPAAACCDKPASDSSHK